MPGQPDTVTITISRELAIALGKGESTIGEGQNRAQTLSLAAAQIAPQLSSCAAPLYTEDGVMTPIRCTKFAGHTGDHGVYRAEPHFSAAWAN